MRGELIVGGSPSLVLQLWRKGKYDRLDINGTHAGQTVVIVYPLRCQGRGGEGKCSSSPLHLSRNLRKLPATWGNLAWCQTAIVQSQTPDERPKVLGQSGRNSAVEKTWTACMGLAFEHCPAGSRWIACANHWVERRNPVKQNLTQRTRNTSPLRR